MHLQGDLQRVFDALFEMGVIEPILHLDWQAAMQDFSVHQDEVEEAVKVVNQTPGSAEILKFALKDFDPKTLGFLAMEVAREFADFHQRKQIH